MISQRQVQVCQHVNCHNRGSAELLAAFQALAPEEVTVCSSGCLGLCNTGPSVRVDPDQVWYYRVKLADVPTIVNEHLKHDRPVEKLLHPRYHIRYV